VIGEGRAQVALVSCDLIGVSRELTAQVREAVTQQTGIPGPSVLVACSHTHAGPATIRVRGCGEVDDAYLATVPGRIAEAVVDAWEGLRPAEIGFATGEVAGLGHNRVEGESGPLDTGLTVLAVRGKGDGAPLATAFNVTAHGVTQQSSNTLISADWPGEASRALTELGGEALYLPGSCGDVNPVLAHTGRSAEAGALVAERVRELLAATTYTEQASCSAAVQEVGLPLSPIGPGELQGIAEAARTRLDLADTPESRATRMHARMELGWAETMLRRQAEGRAEESLRTEVQALRIGAGLFLAHGSELFCEYGLELNRRWAPRPTFVVGYANDFVGYVPDPEDFARGGYAAATVPQMCDQYPFSTDVGARLVEALCSAAREVGL
jgi:hypothetical protein